MGVALEPVNEKPVSLNVAFAKAQPVGTRVSARRWIGRLRLHAGKYILGITAPTGTGVQALHFLIVRKAHFPGALASRGTRPPDIWNFRISQNGLSSKPFFQ